MPKYFCSLFSYYAFISSSDPSNCHYTIEHSEQSLPHDEVRYSGGYVFVVMLCLYCASGIYGVTEFSDFLLAQQIGCS